MLRIYFYFYFGVVVMQSGIGGNLDLDQKYWAPDPGTLDLGTVE